MLLLLLLLLLGAAASKCLHDETQKSVSLLKPLLPQLHSNFRSSSTLPGSRDPQPLRIQTYYVRDPVSDGAWDLEGDGMSRESQVLAAVREAAQRLQGVLAGEWGGWGRGSRHQGGLRNRESGGRRPPLERTWSSKVLR